MKEEQEEKQAPEAPHEPSAPLRELPPMLGTFGDTLHERNEEQAAAMPQHKHGHMKVEHGTKGPTRMLEHGRIFFFYRPKVMHHEVASLNDVQRMHILLCPETGPLFKAATDTLATHKTVKRIITIGKKHLPNISQHERAWAFVSRASDDHAVVRSALDEERYMTHTLGERTADPERPAGEGIYALIEHHGHSHLVYYLQVPHEIGPVQQAFNIEQQGSFLIQVRNPSLEATMASVERLGTQPGLSGNTRVTYPPDLLRLFHDRRWIAVQDTRLLDYDNVELLVIGSKEDFVAELGKESQMFVDAAQVNIDAQQVLKDLGLVASEHPTKSLETGNWV